MEDNRLVSVSDTTFSFDGIEYNYNDYRKTYHDDNLIPFEQEAFDQERIIANAYWDSI